MSDVFVHETVLRYATVHALVCEDFNPKASWIHDPIEQSRQRKGVFVDGTFGRGGHSRYLLKHLADDAKLLVFDKDPLAIQSAHELAAEDSRVIVLHQGFSSLEQVLQELHIEKIQGLLLDLGISSPQIDDPTRGFSFMKAGPLDMRMNNSQGLTAEEWLASATVKEIKEVLENYGEERNAFRIAKAIDTRRKTSRIQSTLELAELVSQTIGRGQRGHHPATRTFQAIRIHINSEIQELQSTLSFVLNILDRQARLAVISFHSLEDRLVKRTIQKATTQSPDLAKLPLTESQLPPLSMRSMGRVYATQQEVDRNVRSRSAVLRVAEKIV